MASNIDWAKFQEGYEEIFARLEGLQKGFEGVVSGGTPEDIAESLAKDSTWELDTKIINLDLKTDDVLAALRDWIGFWLVPPSGLDSARERVLKGRNLYEQKKYGSGNLHTRTQHFL